LSRDSCRLVKLTRPPVFVKPSSVSCVRSGPPGEVAQKCGRLTPSRRPLDTPDPGTHNSVVVARGVQPMTPAHRIEAVLSEDGKLSLDNLPFRAGQAVKVIVLPAAGPPAPAGQSLRGMVLRYDRPTDPVAEADWDALR
jgi:hypothetical protein